MIKQIVLIVIFNYTLFSQLKIDVYRLDENQLSYEIENLILKQIVTLHMRKTNEKLIFQIKKIKYFKNLLQKLKTTKNPLSMAMSGITVTKDRKKEFSFSNPYIFVNGSAC